MHLWIKMVIDKKMGWGKRLNEILLIQVSYGRTSYSLVWDLCLYIFIYILNWLEYGLTS